MASRPAICGAMQAPFRRGGICAKYGHHAKIFGILLAG
jgi:hypothetical protein